MAEPSNAALVRQVAIPLAAAILAANLIGALVVFGFIAWVLPLPDVPDEAAARRANGIAFVAMLAVFVPLGFVLSLLRARPVLRWLRERRPPRSGRAGVRPRRSGCVAATARPGSRVPHSLRAWG